MRHLAKVLFTWCLVDLLEAKAVWRRVVPSGLPGGGLLDLVPYKCVTWQRSSQGGRLQVGYLGKVSFTRVFLIDLRRRPH